MAEEGKPKKGLLGKSVVVGLVRTLLGMADVTQGRISN